MAYSRVTHITFLIVALCVGSEIGLVTRVLLSLSHGVTAFLMFFVVGKIYERAGRRRIVILRSGAGLGVRFLGVWALVLFQNCGFPPFLGFAAEVCCVIRVLSESVSIIVAVLTGLFVSGILCYVILASTTLEKEEFLMASKLGNEIKVLIFAYSL